MPLYNGTHIADRARMKKILTLFDPYIGLMMIMIACAAVFPVRGEGAAIAATTADVAIAFLFFLYGTRLSPKAAVAGLFLWKLHIAVDRQSVVEGKECSVRVITGGGRSHK